MNQPEPTQGIVASQVQTVLKKPENVELEQQAVVLIQQGKLQEAETIYRALIAEGSTNPIVYCNLAGMCGMQGKLGEMIELLHKTLEMKPDYCEAHYNLGYALQQQGDLDAAIHAYQVALAIQPSYADAAYNLGCALYEKNDIDAAINAYQKVIELKPDCIEVYNNLGNCFHFKGEFSEAIASFKKSIALKPDYADAHANLSVTLLLLGDYSNGWKEYEWKRHREIAPVRPHVCPSIEQWDGTPLQAGEKLLLVSEQGIGDTLQFMRYMFPLRAQGIDVSICAQPQLHSLIQASGIDSNPYSPDQANQIIEGKWISLLSLPRHLSINPKNPLMTDPYIKPLPDRIEYWRQQLEGEQKPIIGVNWQGNPDAERSYLRGRSFPLEYFVNIAQGNVKLLSLQKGYGSEQMDTCSFRDRFVSCQQYINHIWDFLEIAAIIANCDLIITSDTAVAHLAGGMGKTTWVLLQKIPDWRWGIDTDTSFWYPSMSLFRQQESGNWYEVFERVGQALAIFLTQHQAKAQKLHLWVPVSLGELVDKITILEIKAHRLPTERLPNILKELQALQEILDALPINIDSKLICTLKEINTCLWDIEDAIREQELRQDFGHVFIQLARSVYQQNDRRSAVKREINTRYGSELMEEKFYVNYSNSPSD